MAVKTITIDLEAYELLRRRKGAGKSFSDVIKERFGRREPRTVGRLLHKLSAAALSEHVLDTVDAIVEARARSVPDVPELAEGSRSARARATSRTRSSGRASPRSPRDRA